MVTRKDLGPQPLVVVGAEDPEALRIQEVITEENLPFVYARYRGERVDPRTAYLFDTPSDISPCSSIVLVECFPAPKTLSSIKRSIDNKTNYTNFFVIDHHREGDPGFAAPAAKSWAASSLGQLCTLLDRAPDKRDLAMAAMDHNFAAALRGEVPNVTPQEVLELYLNEITEHTNTPRKELEELVTNYRQIIVASKSIRLTQDHSLARGSVRDMRDIDIGLLYSDRYLTAKLALLLERTSAILTTRNSDDPNESEKIILMGEASPDCVCSFINEFAAREGLSEIYGSAARGYAGGYKS